MNAGQENLSGIPEVTYYNQSGDSRMHKLVILIEPPDDWAALMTHGLSSCTMQKVCRSPPRGTSRVDAFLYGDR